MSDTILNWRKKENEQTVLFLGIKLSEGLYDYNVTRNIFDTILHECENLPHSDQYEIKHFCNETIRNETRQFHETTTEFTRDINFYIKRVKKRHYFPIIETNNNVGYHFKSVKLEKIHETSFDPSYGINFIEYMWVRVFKGNGWNIRFEIICDDDTITNWDPDKEYVSLGISLEFDS